MSDPVPRKRLSSTLIEQLVVTLAIAAGLLGLVFLSVYSRIPPLTYHDGKNQLQWQRQLYDDDPAKAEQAVVALSHIALNPKCKTRYSVINSLASQGPKAASAIPALEAILQNEDDRHLWEVTCAALEEIQAPPQESPRP